MALQVHYNTRLDRPRVSKSKQLTSYSSCFLSHFDTAIFHEVLLLEHNPRGNSSPWIAGMVGIITAIVTPAPSDQLPYAFILHAQRPIDAIRSISLHNGVDFSITVGFPSFSLDATVEKIAMVKGTDVAVIHTFPWGEDGQRVTYVPFIPLNQPDLMTVV